MCLEAQKKNSPKSEENYSFFIQMYSKKKREKERKKRVVGDFEKSVEELPITLFSAVKLPAFSFYLFSCYIASSRYLINYFAKTTLRLS